MTEQFFFSWFSSSSTPLPPSLYFFAYRVNAFFFDLYLRGVAAKRCVHPMLASDLKHEQLLLSLTTVSTKAQKLPAAPQMRPMFSQKLTAVLLIHVAPSYQAADLAGRHAHQLL